MTSVINYFVIVASIHQLARYRQIPVDRRIAERLESKQCLTSLVNERVILDEELKSQVFQLITALMYTMW